jgi:hypothetical protein
MKFVRNLKLESRKSSLTSTSLFVFIIEQVALEQAHAVCETKQYLGLCWEHVEKNLNMCLEFHWAILSQCLLCLGIASNKGLAMAIIGP